MKKILLLLVIVAAAFTGCKKSDSKLIANKWTGVSLLIQEFDSSGVLKNSETEPITVVLDFKSDGTFTSTDGTSAAQSGTWTIVEKILTLSRGTDKEIYTIKELTSEVTLTFSR
jgi:predicted component of type VI protein secretion system